MEKRPTVSSCPAIDLHSVYVDGELPQPFLRQYEEHLKTCSLCQKRLESVRRVHEIFSSDGSTIVLSDVYKSQSYDRLKTKMRFSRNIKLAKPKKSPTKALLYSYSLKGLAAAAVLALAFLLGFKSQEGKGSPAPSNQVAKVLKRPKMSDDFSNFGSNAPSTLAYDVSTSRQPFGFGPEGVSPIGQDSAPYVYNGAPYAYKGAMIIGAPSMLGGSSFGGERDESRIDLRSRAFLNVEFDDVDVFRPNFNQHVNQNHYMGGALPFSPAYNHGHHHAKVQDSEQ